MSKKNKFFSWLGFGKKKQQESQEEQVNANQAESEQTKVEPELVEEPPVQQESPPAAESDIQNEALPEETHEPASTDVTAEVAPSTSAPLTDAGTSPQKIASNEVVTELEGSSTDDNGTAVTQTLLEVEPDAAPTDLKDEDSVVAEETTQVNNLAHQDISNDEHQALAPATETTEPSSSIEPSITTPVDAQTTDEVIVAEDAEHAMIDVAQSTDSAGQASEPEMVPEPQAKPEKKGFFARLKDKLSKTKQSIGSGLANLFLGKKIDDELYEDLETQMIMADVGVDTTLKIINRLTEHADRKQLKDGDALYEKLKEELSDMLTDVDIPLEIDTSKSPYVVLMVGVNGVGKTTTIGKMAKQLQAEGKSVMLAAGDTFRAAAVEQLQVWGQRNDIPVVAQHTGADSASVIFDAFESAKSRGVDVLIADTAGRLQNKDNLMEELKKVVRVMQKLSPDAPHEIMLTVDAGTGQNAISQAKLFNEAVGITGITLTKLDGTAKGGVIFSIADQFSIPIRYIGVGEGIDDLRTFNSQDFIEAIFSQEAEEQA